MMKVRFAWIAALLFAAPAFASYVPSTVYTDSQGREWIDITAAVWREWAEIAETCDASIGACDGVLPASSHVSTGDWGTSPTDLTGFTWASRAEVVSMLTEVGLHVWDYFTESCCIGTAEEAPYALTNGFTRDGAAVVMLTSTQTGVGEPGPHTIWRIDGGSGTGHVSPNFYDPSIGGWFYRQPVSVTEPSGLALLVAGLGATVFGRRRRAVSTERSR